MKDILLIVGTFIVTSLFYLSPQLMLLNFNHEQKTSKYFKTKNFDYFIRLSNNYAARNYGKTNKELCGAYTQLAIEHAVRRNSENCDSYIRLYQNDPANQWSIDYKTQFNWCLTVSVSAVVMESIYRERRLKDCIIGL